MNNGFCKTLPENFSEFGARGSGNHIGCYFIATADRIFYAFCRLTLQSYDAKMPLAVKFGPPDQIFDFFSPRKQKSVANRLVFLHVQAFFRNFA